VFGEQADRVGELALGRVNAADQDVQDEVDALDVRQPLALLTTGAHSLDGCVGGGAHRDQRRDQILAGVLAGGDQVPQAYS
jgi:hypothetical protein